MDTRFIDRQPEIFDGALVVFNIGNNNFGSLGLTAEYKMALTEAVKSAQAGGRAVIYLFGFKIGTMPPPDDLPLLEGFDYPRSLPIVCGMQEADLPVGPAARATVLSKIMGSIIESSQISFSKESLRMRGWHATGICTIDGQQVVLPVTEVIPSVSSVA